MKNKLKYIAIFIGIGTVSYFGFQYYVQKTREKYDNKVVSVKDMSKAIEDLR